MALGSIKPSWFTCIIYSVALNVCKAFQKVHSYSASIRIGCSWKNRTLFCSGKTFLWHFVKKKSSEEREKQKNKWKKEDKAQLLKNGKLILAYHDIISSSETLLAKLANTSEGVNTRKTTCIRGKPKKKLL